MIRDLPSSWVAVPLSAVCEINPRTKSDLKTDDLVSFVPMAAISEHSGSIVAIETRPLEEVRKGFTPFQDGDVLFAKITPCMENGKAAIARGLVNGQGYGSTEFHVLRPSSLVMAEWLYAIIRTTEFRRAAAASFQGAVGQQRVTADFLRRFRIPLPPLSEQQRIVDILQEAEEIRRLRAQADAKAAQLTPSMFRGLFGEIGSNSNNWPTVPISYFVESFQGGKSLTGIETDFDVTRPRVLKISAVTSGVLNPRESKALPSSYEPPKTHFVKPGDLLITRANTAELVGATALIGNECPANLVLPDKIWRFIWKKDFLGTPEFVWALFQEQATRQALGNIASGTGGSMKNISMKKLMQMRVIWPPKGVQETFSEALREVALLCNASEGDRAAQALQSSLSAHAFSGQLTADWRDTNSTDLAIEAKKRDEALKAQMSGKVVQLSGRFVTTVTATASLTFKERTDGVYSDLNREQRFVLKEIKRMVGGVDYIRYFNARMLGDYIDKPPLRKNPQAIEGHIAVLAARGLLIPVSREEQTEDTGEYLFGNAYRLPLKDSRGIYTDASGEPYLSSDGEPFTGEETPGDHTRLREMERLVDQLEKERMLQ